MILIQCVQSKQDEPLPAKKLYDSTYFDAMKRYAEATNSEWRILSAKHGLLHPETQIRPYDAFGLSTTQAKTIANHLTKREEQSVTIIAGQKYTGPLTPALESVGIDVVELCRGLKIGERIAMLQTKARALENHTL